MGRACASDPKITLQGLARRAPGPRHTHPFMELPLHCSLLRVNMIRLGLLYAQAIVTSYDGINSRKHHGKYGENNRDKMNALLSCEEERPRQGTPH